MPVRSSISNTLTIGKDIEMYRDLNIMIGFKHTYQVYKTKTMKTQTDKVQESQNSITPRVTSEASNGGTAQLMDNRTSTIDQRTLQGSMNTNTENSRNPVQQKASRESPALSPERSRRANNTGLPDNLKSGIENLSGYSMDDVKVHYNSSKPAQLQAHAYAQGTNIHLAPGQEKHLPHEAWHVVQQKQGRVKPTRQLKSKVHINDDVGLEKEADVMGAKALSSKHRKQEALSHVHLKDHAIQMERYSHLINQYNTDANEGDRVLVIEVNLSGSANKHIAPSDTNRNETWTDVENDKFLPVHSVRDHEDAREYFRMQIEFEGPGAERTTGAKSYGYGTFDGGSNGTYRLKKLVPLAVESMVTKAPNEQWKKKVIIITAHSRGAVAAYHVAQKLKKDHQDWHVELAQFDPVPGPGQIKENIEGYPREGLEDDEYQPLDNHTVIYSVASGWGTVFTPMKLHDMTRLIITQDGHSAGVGKSFFYNAQWLKRSELNSLPEGVYVDACHKAKDYIVLKRVRSAREAKKEYRKIYKSGKYYSDRGRAAIIEQAIDDILGG